jgi:hypothetical protein
MTAIQLFEDNGRCGAMREAERSWMHPAFRVIRYLPTGVPTATYTYSRSRFIAPCGRFRPSALTKARFGGPVAYPLAIPPTSSSASRSRPTGVPLTRPLVVRERLALTAVPDRLLPMGRLRRRDDDGPRRGDFRSSVAAAPMDFSSWVRGINRAEVVHHRRAKQYFEDRSRADGPRWRRDRRGDQQHLRPQHAAGFEV